MQARLFSFTFWVQLHLCVCHLQSSFNLATKDSILDFKPF